MLVILHLILITLSNVLVQYPFTVLGLHTTWGALTYPMIFILTDLTVRTQGPEMARKVIFTAMLPSLLISYAAAVLSKGGEFQGLSSLYSLHWLPARIAIACFAAYSVGQLLDIKVFQQFRQQGQWWLAPAVSSTLGNFIDTAIFFSVAFYHSTDSFLGTHWPEIAMVDFMVKMLMTCFAFIPFYGLLLRQLIR